MERTSVEVTIEKFTLKGYGVGPLSSGKEVEVAHAVPGDRLLVEWKKKKRPPQKGRLLQVIAPSDSRVVPKCAHAAVCGGCSWQQIDYQAQLQEKQRRIQRAFPDFLAEPILPSKELFGYRNKMEFTFSENRGGQKYLGLMIAQAEPYVFNLSECWLGPPWFSEAVCRVRSWWEGSKISAYRPLEDVGALRYLTLRSSARTGQKMAILNVSGNPEYALNRQELDSFAEAIKGAAGGDVSIFLRIHQTKKGTPTQFFEMHLSGPDAIYEELTIDSKKLLFKISPSSFFQPNTLQAEKLYQTAIDLLEEKTDVLFDLYSGTGTLAMAASTRAKKVIAIELSSEAVLDAKENLTLNQIENVTFHQGDVGKVLTKLLEEKGFERPDAAIVDPPRAGLDPLAINHLKALLPKKIVYISCNPLTQAENIQELKKAGYRLVRLKPVDQFPHTYHIENIALLIR